MSNVAPEHGPTPFGTNRTGLGLPAGGGSRPAAPATDSYGTVSAGGPESMAPFFDPGDSDNDMDEDGPGDID